MNELKIARGLSLPAEAVTQTFAFLARRGAGKTHAASVMAEEMIEAGFPVAILDPVGVWWGLRSRHPVVILGGEHGDVALEPTTGRMLAGFLIREKRPTIFDLSGMGEGEMVRFVADLCDEFYRKTDKTPWHWFLDEADEFAPQGGQTTGGSMPACLGAVQRMTRRGRARGIGLTAMTQRSAVLNKSVLTQTECLIAMQTTAPQDLAAIDDWIKYHGTKAERDEIMSALPKLQQGEAFIYSPGWLQSLTRIKFRARKSFDSSSTPKAGEKPKAPKSLESLDLNALRTVIGKAVEEAKANDPKELKGEIARLRKRVAEKPGVDPTAVESAVATAIAERDRWWRSRIMKEAKGPLSRARDLLNDASREVSSTIGELLDSDLPPAPNVPATPVKQNGRLFANAQRTAHKSARNSQPSECDIQIGGGALRMIQVIADAHPAGFTEAQWATQSKLKRTGGTWGTYKSRLNRAGLIVEDRGLYFATDEAAAQYGDPSRRPQSPDELIAYWKQKIGAGAAGKLIDPLADAYPDGLKRDDLAEAVGMSASGGSFGTYLSRLTSNGLAESRGGIVSATPALMEP